jgi:hypothetical protein
MKNADVVVVPRAGEETRSKIMKRPRFGANRRRWLVALAVTFLLAAAAPRASASVRLKFDVAVPPVLVPIPGSPVAYAPRVDANYFSYGGQYYCFVDGVWYVSDTYNGPWDVLAPDMVPYPILVVPIAYYRFPLHDWSRWRRDQPPRWATLYPPPMAPPHEEHHDGRRNQG